MRIAAANTAWMLANVAGAARFRQALGQPEAVQRRILAGYLQKNAGTHFGQWHGFSQITSAEEYQKRVPIWRYEDYEPFMRRIAAGEANVLTHETIRYFALSSGSAGAEKWIPYTGGLVQEFGRAIGPWIVNLFRSIPTLRGGPAYWSITPVNGERNDLSRVPVGFDEDSAYLGGFFKRVVDATFAVPGALRHAADMDSFRYLTLLCLLGTEDLRLISVWHPSFLSLLLFAAEPVWDRLLDDIRTGQCRPPRPVRRDVMTAVSRRARPNAARADRLRRCGCHDVSAFWPQLALISCWTSGHAALAAGELARLFPQTPIQGKGLLSTEGFVSLPIAEGEGTQYPLALRSHFFEFLPDSGAPVMAHKVDGGAEYTILLSTAGGLYRYNTGDRVRITGRLRETPCLVFVGKSDNVSDRCGEKLHSAFVGEVLGQLYREFTLAPRFGMLAPDGAGYTLFLELPTQPPEEIGTRLDALLSGNPHFAYCRSLGQLQCTRLFLITAGGEQSYMESCRVKGQRLGNIKPTPLHRDDGWASRFEGEYFPDYPGVR